MDSEAWWATVHGLQRVRHEWVPNMSSRDDLRYTEECAQVICKYFRLQPLGVSVSEAVLESILHGNWGATVFTYLDLKDKVLLAIFQVIWNFKKCNLCHRICYPIIHSWFESLLFLKVLFKNVLPEVFEPVREMRGVLVQASQQKDQGDGWSVRHLQKEVELLTASALHLSPQCLEWSFHHAGCSDRNDVCLRAPHAKSVFFKFDWGSESPQKGLWKHVYLGSTLRVSDSVVLGWGLRIQGSSSSQVNPTLRTNTP